MKTAPPLDLISTAERNRIREFYDGGEASRWGRAALPELRAQIQVLIDHYLAPADRLVELGCGQGALEGIHPRYVGLDLSRRALQKFFSPTTPRVQASMEELPLRSAAVGMVVSVAALEHVPRPERCLEEIARVLRPGGLLYLAPAWFCRPWAARGLHVRSFRELRWRDRVEKLTLPLRNHLLFRAVGIFPQRLWSELEWRARHRPLPFRYRRLQPNLNQHITSDSDAFVSMDPHRAILFFLSRGYDIVSAPGFWRRFTVRHLPVVVRKPTVDV
ncbi:MAG: class I SAM-dependent methyltransferase [Terriglobia bacterium]